MVFCSRIRSRALLAVLCAATPLLGTGCLVKGGETTELVLKGSIAESSEVVELDPVFLSRQKQVEQQFFGFSKDDTPLDNATDLASEDDLSEAGAEGDAGDVDVALDGAGSLPFAHEGSFGVALRWPLKGDIKVTSLFGMRSGRLHAGVDLKGYRGDPIVSAADGQVLSAKRKRAYGIVAIVGHDNDRQTLYAHMLRLAVREGDFVKAGTVIGYVGRTGRSTGYHLHFETRVAGGVPQNPLQFLPGASNLAKNDMYRTHESKNVAASEHAKNQAEEVVAQLKSKPRAMKVASKVSSRSKARLRRSAKAAPVRAARSAKVTYAASKGSKALRTN